MNFNCQNIYSEEYDQNSLEFCIWMNAAGRFQLNYFLTFDSNDVHARGC